MVGSMIMPKRQVNVRRRVPKATRMRNADFNIPKKIKNLDFEELCGTYNIPATQQQMLRMRLDSLVEEFAKWMRAERKQADRGSDREHLDNTLSHLRSAAAK